MFAHTLLAFPLLLGSAFVQADCEVTPEYAEVRAETYHLLHENYEQCRSAVFADRYWKAYVDCKIDGSGENVGGGCAHVAGNFSSKHMDEPDPAAHCNYLKPSKVEISEAIKLLAEERNITCR